MTETSKLLDNRKQRYKAFNSSLTRIMSNNNANVLVRGDFNCGNIDWSTMQVPEGVPQRQVQSQLLEIVQDHCLSQIVNFHTREDKTLDLLLTNSPSPVNRVKGMQLSARLITTLSILNMTLRLNGSNKPRGRSTSINELIWMVFETI